MVLRQLGATDKEKQSLIEESVDTPKEAIAIDSKDGVSWRELIAEATACATHTY
jgi:hypothetical protein